MGGFVRGKGAIQIGRHIAFSLTVFFSIVFLAVPAVSQTAYDVESDQLEIFNREGRAIFEGNVHLWNDTTSIRSNRLEVFYVNQGDTIDHLEAFGDVEIDRDSMLARSNYAYHHVQNDTALLQEEAYVRRNGSEFWADKIWIDMAGERIRMKNNVRGHLVEPSGDTETAD